MDEKQLNYEFMSILSESHPGLTFEEYRDNCVFLLFYQYLCLRFNDAFEEQYKLSAMVRLAVRGKLQLGAFIKFAENASPFIHMAGAPFQLTEFSFYQKLLKVQSLEKQKSFARFIRKLIKKMDSWDCPDMLYAHFGDLFGKLLVGFSRMKKDTYISEGLLSLHHMFFEGENVRKVFLPDFQYGILLGAMLSGIEEGEIFGYEQRESLMELFRMYCYIKHVPKESLHICRKEVWESDAGYAGQFDAVSIFMPDGVEPGTLLLKREHMAEETRQMTTVAKGEFPLILSALPLLRDRGLMTVVIPSALLYREGKEAQIRRFLVEEMNCLEAVMLLPDHAFQSTGQNEVLLFFRKNREREEIMFFDCSEMDSLEGEDLSSIRNAWKEKKTVPGFCSLVSRKHIKENDYNLNLPRYITRSVRAAQIDLEQRRRRIEEIDRELLEIEKRIAMYRRDLNL